MGNSGFCRAKEQKEDRMFFIRRNPWHRDNEVQSDAVAQRGLRNGYGSPLAQLQSEMDKWFNSGLFTLMPVFAGGGEKEEARDSILTPRLDIHGDDKAYAVSVELPGVSEKDINIEVREGNLVISGEKKSEHEIKETGKDGGTEGYRRVERMYGSFRRVLGLPEDVDPEAIKAVFKDGVLNVTLPRKDEKEALAKKIEITAG